MAIIQLRGGTGSAIQSTKVVTRTKKNKAVEAARAATEKKHDEEVEAEAAAMKRHREVRPDKQKIAF